MERLKDSFKSEMEGTSLLIISYAAVAEWGGGRLVQVRFLVRELRSHMPWDQGMNV